MSSEDRADLNIFAAYSVSDDAVYCIDCTVFLSTEKQRLFGSFVSKVLNCYHNIPQKPETKYSESLA